MERDPWQSNVVVFLLCSEGAFGTLGVGMGFAMGASLVRPDHAVVLLWGDGSAG